MVRLLGGLLLFSALALASPPRLPPSAQKTLQQDDTGASALRKLKGRFLHITDVHPDPFYETHSASDTDHICHRGSGSAGYYGAEVTDCDSPFSLANATFAWIRDNIRDDIDFVIWTGDSARHDNDEEHPRSDKQVVDLNNYLVDKFVEVFGATDKSDPTNHFVVPIIPTFGNNDILPHNIFTRGPNRWTRKYADIWHRFVPEEQRHSFARGGWFYTEVIRNKLAVFSLNTLYFFDSNSAVDGCDSKSEPGYEHMEWLRIQLQFLRERGMKAIMTGHVPPARTESKQSWDETCWQKYTLWMRQYRDVVVGNIYGHMNIDHFMFQDAQKLKYKFKIKGLHRKPPVAAADEVYSEERLRTNDDFTVAAKTTYLNELRDEWSALPTPPRGLEYTNSDLDAEIKKKSKKKKKRDKFLKDIGGPWAERFSMCLVSPSVVPNFYPTLRLIEYNITGLEQEHPASSLVGDIQTTELDAANPSQPRNFQDDKEYIQATSDTNNHDDDLAPSQDKHADADKKKKKHKKKKKKTPKPDFKVPRPPSKSTPPGPAYSPQTFTFLSFKQYFANLTTINAEWEKAKSERDDADVKIGEKAQKERKVKFEYELEYDTKNDSVYSLNDLTVRSWLDLAKRMGRKKGGTDAMGLLQLTHDYYDDDHDDNDDDDDGIEDEKGDVNPDRVAGTLDRSHRDETSPALAVSAAAPGANDGVKAGRTDDHRQNARSKGKKKPKKELGNRQWKAFVQRAFVQTKPDGELDEEFGE